MPAKNIESRPLIGPVELKAQDELSAAEEFFHAKIPITRAMGVRVVADDQHALVVEAPVALNYNHLHTAFGGSINAVATLAGYGLLWMELREESAHVVIAQSSIRFLRPVREIIRGVCARPAAEELDALRTTLRETGRAGIVLYSRIEEDGETAAEFQATFVAIRDPVA